MQKSSQRKDIYKSQKNRKREQTSPSPVSVVNFRVTIPFVETTPFLPSYIFNIFWSRLLHWRSRKSGMAAWGKTPARRQHKEQVLFSVRNHFGIEILYCQQPASLNRCIGTHACHHCHTFNYKYILPRQPLGAEE